MTSTTKLKQIPKCGIFIRNGLLLSLAGAVVIRKAKTYTKKIMKISDLGKDVQVTVEKGDEFIAQYFCDEESCWNTPNTKGQLTEQLGYLVLTMQNIRTFDRFDAFKYGKSGKTTILQKFILDEVLPTSATPDLTDEALNPSITQTGPPTSTIPALTYKADKRNSQKETCTVCATKAVVVALGTTVAVVALAFLALTVTCKRAGQDGGTHKVIAFFKKI